MNSIVKLILKTGIEHCQINIYLSKNSFKKIFEIFDYNLRYLYIKKSNPIRIFRKIKNLLNHENRYLLSQIDFTGGFDSTLSRIKN